MRYRDFKIFEKEDAVGRFDASVNMNNFYNNMELLINTTNPSQAPSDLEGIDAVVRLGYMGSVSDSVLQRLGTSTPTQAGFGGQYDSADDTVIIKWDYVFKPTDRLPGTSTTAHELRHRAFQIMSIDPRFNSLLPSELTTGQWKDGWGRNIDREKYWITATKGFYEGQRILTMPEHAMIYAVQFKNIETHEKAEWVNNSVLGNKGAAYWRDLYKGVNDAVKTFFREHFDAKDADAMYPARGRRSDSRDSTAGDIIELSPQMKAYYTSWKFLNNTEEDIFLQAAMYVRAIQADAWRYDWVHQLADVWQKGYLRDVDAWMKKHKRRLLGLNSGFQRSLDAIERTRPYWNLLDIRNFTDAQVRTIVGIPNRPAATPVTVRPVPVKPNPAKPTAPTTVVAPAGTTIGFIQFAQQNKRGSRTLWQLILASSTAAELTAVLNETALQAAMAGLRLDRSTKVHLDLLPDVWDLVQGAAARKILAETYLSKVVLVK